tara:strand:- start:932 stop:1054 length:123 start_codon:yes stop_codon:yes gene_type:complete
MQSMCHDFEIPSYESSLTCIALIVGRIKENDFFPALISRR